MIVGTRGTSRSDFFNGRMHEKNPVKKPHENEEGKKRIWENALITVGYPDCRGAVPQIFPDYFFARGAARVS